MRGNFKEVNGIKRKISGFLVCSGKIDQDSFVWNMMGSMLMAFQSTIMLMVLTRVVGLTDAGIFTIAYANANLFLNIGKYSMRNYQVSDVKNKFSFWEYRDAKKISTWAMVIVSVGYVLVAGTANEYSMKKSMVILWMCLFKVVDAIEDVYHGLYQQRGRLDIAGKALTIRMTITIFAFAVLLIVLKDLLNALIWSTVLTTAIFFLLNNWIFDEFCGWKKKKGNKRKTICLLKECLPLCVGSFLAFYINNAPKYAIDSYLSDEIQACYGFVAMPVFVIGVLNSFIFSPLIYKISICWEKNDKRGFINILLRQLVVVVIITLICLAGAYAIGIPVLSAMYNTDLSSYKAELLVLLIAGGFLALSGLLGTAITIIRCQNYLLIGYALVAVIAYILSPVFVEKYSMLGASILYAVLTSMLCIILGLFLISRVRKNGK